MKKTYIKPEASIFDVELSNIIAASLGVNDDTEVDTSVDGGQLGREDNTPSNPNLWEQTW